MYEDRFLNFFEEYSIMVRDTQIVSPSGSIVVATRASNGKPVEYRISLDDLLAKGGALCIGRSSDENIHITNCRGKSLKNLELYDSEAGVPRAYKDGRPRGVIVQYDPFRNTVMLQAVEFLNGVAVEDNLRQVDMYTFQSLSTNNVYTTSGLAAMLGRYMNFDRNNLKNIVKNGLIASLGPGEGVVVRLSVYSREGYRMLIAYER